MPRPKIFPPAVGDHCYLRHGDRSLIARVFMPRGDTGPFPCLIDLHGGGWQGGDLEDRAGLGRYAGHIGCVIVSLNFRHGADAYPSSLIDINYGIRWVKANAARFKIDTGRIAIGGTSTGGHLAMLTAMRLASGVIRRSRCRQAPPASMPACRPSSCTGRSSIRCRAIALCFSLTGASALASSTGRTKPMRRKAIRC